MNEKGLERISLRDYAEESYLNYSMYVILDRALPHLGDGMKPVQRRILYAMSELGLNAASKYKKSARTVGDVIGKFHPHGDSAAYEAMVLMAQHFSFRYPLVDGQGNWGTQDDPKSFAAMRYTESKLTNFANLLLDELKLGTVDWQLNFDGSLLEPKILPAKVPSILLNGTTGIAVGMATDIPSHNLTEVINAAIYLLDNPKASVKELMKYIKGPDFSNKSPIIASPEELLEMYETGRGGFKMRAAWEKEGTDIIINALPYQTSGAKVLEQIADQMNKKKVPMIVDIRDEGDHEYPTRIVISLKSNRIDAEEVINHLYATTDLQKNFRANFNVINLEGSPKVFSLNELLKEWLQFRQSTVLRKLEHRIDQVSDRLHILDGLLIVFADIDEVIKIIRNSDEPKKDLIKRFKISDVQANAILEIRLRQLAKLEEIKLQEEQAKLSTEFDELEKIINSKSRLKTYIKNELNEILAEFGDDRCSPIEEGSQAKAFTDEDILTSEPITVILSKAGWIRAAKGHDIDGKSLSYRGEDSLQDYARGKNNQQSIFFASNGKSFSLPAHSLPSARGLGEPLTGKVNLESGESFVATTIGNDEDRFLIASDAGYGFIAQLSDAVSGTKSGKNFMKLSKGANVLGVRSIKNHHTYIAAISNIGRMLIFGIEELPQLSKGKGNKIINIPTPKFESGEEKLIAVCLLGDISELKIHSGKQFMKVGIKDLENYFAARAKRGLMLPQGYRKVDNLEEVIPNQEVAE